MEQRYKGSVYLSYRNMYALQKVMEKGIEVIPTTGRVKTCSASNDRPTFQVLGYRYGAQ